MTGYTTQAPGKDKEKSAYYWWFEFLRRSDSYKEQCRRKSGGKVYQDFGDIFQVEFEDWWDSHELLFLPGSSFGVWPVETDAEFKEAKKDNWIVVKVDPSCSKEYLMFYFEDMLDERGLNKKGRVRHNHDVVEPARYPLIRRSNTDFLKIALAVYDEHLVNPKPLYKIGEKCNVLRLHYPRDTDEKRAVLTSAVSRYLRRARCLIKNAEQGVFPKG